MKSIFELSEKKSKNKDFIIQKLIQRIEALERNVELMHKERELTEKNNVDKLVEKIDEINSKLNKEEQVEEIYEPLEPLNLENSYDLEEIAPSQNINKKEDVMQKILNILSGKEWDISQLKKIVVNEEKICSKASFYRYIKELQDKEEINSIFIDGRKIIINKNWKSKISSIN